MTHTTQLQISGEMWWWEMITHISGLKSAAVMQYSKLDTMTGEMAYSLSNTDTQNCG
jgi:N-glycosylase/DNA lyase